MTTNYAFKNTFLTQLMTINVRSREFPNALTRMLASQESVNNAMALKGEDAVTLVDILDQAFEAPGMSLDLRRRSVRILRRVCGLQTILPRSCILSENISKEGDIEFAPGGFANVWKGRHSGNPVCIKAFRAYTAENLSKIKQRLFQEIVIWRRLSHPNVLPVLGISPKLFPLCVISEWMIDGNIMDFTSRHPEVNRLRLLAEAASGLQYLHLMDIIHSDVRPTNIVIDSNFHARLTDYGLIAIISDPNTVDPGSTTSPSVGTVRYMAPELLNPSGFGLKNNNPTKKSDTYALGMVTYQVVTGEQPFRGAKDGVIIYSVVTGERPSRPSGSNEWVSDDIWNFISRCWSSSWDGRPEVDFAINALNDAADAIETKRVKSYVTNGQERKTSRSGSVSIQLSGRRVDVASVQAVRPPSPPPPLISSTPSPFVTKTAPDSKAKEKEREKQQQREFRTWHDSSGLHWLHAALVHYKAGIVRLSSSDGTLLNIPEDKLCPEDLHYLQARDAHKRAQRKNSTSFIPWLTRLNRRDGADKVIRHPNTPPESQLRIQEATPQISHTSASSAAPADPWETDLIAFLQEHRGGTENDLARKEAQEFADKLDTALVDGDLSQRKRRYYLRHLRKLCGSFGILPPPLLIAQTFDESGTTPLAFGGSSNVHKATFEGRSVAVKKIRFTNAGNLDRVRRFLIEEVVGWKFLKHRNIVPFIGVALTPPLFSIISEWMVNGDIMCFTRTHPEYNRLDLLIDTVTGLEYLHKQGIVHGDLKGANILIDSDRHARLADFGLAVVIDESGAGSVIEDGGIRGTVRWMAPELMHPEMFDFSRECQMRLPSKGTDIYALGMTILEVITGCHPFNSVIREPAVISRVLDGGRPDRPSSGFPDQLWGLVTATWLVEYGTQPSKRPPTSTILGWLKKEVDNWGKSIIPPDVVESAGRVGYLMEDDATDNDLTIINSTLSPSHPPKRDRAGSPGIADNIREFFRLGIS